MQGRRDGAVALGRARQRGRGRLFYVENNYPTVHNGFTTRKQLFIGHYYLYCQHCKQKKNYLLATAYTKKKLFIGHQKPPISGKNRQNIHISWRQKRQ
jgi:hypothetical protein